MLLSAMLSYLLYIFRKKLWAGNSCKSHPTTAQLVCVNNSGLKLSDPKGPFQSKPFYDSVILS